MKDAAQRLADKTRADSNGCHVWHGSRDRGGYGRIAFRGTVWWAHRLAWLLEHGEIPNGFCVCHICDTPSCVNPDHLFLGTQKDNMIDMANKGRAFMGAVPPILTGEAWQAAHPIEGRRYKAHKLTSEIVSQIRSLYSAKNISQSELGNLFGISQVMVSKVVRKEAWNRA